MAVIHQDQKPIKQKQQSTRGTAPTVADEPQTSRAKKRGRKRSMEAAVPRLRHALTSNAETFHVTVAEAGKGTMEVPREALAVLTETMALIASGRAVEVVAKSMELSTIQAAKTLGVSRPHLIKLLDRGAIEFRMVGTHRRVDVASLEDYQRHEQNERAQRRRTAVASAVGSTEAEGLRVSADTTADLDAYASGELDAAALRARALARYSRKAAE